MRRTRFDQMDCPIARSLERVGERWSMLILRDAFAGLSRFDEFSESHGVATSILTRRLGRLVESGLLAKHHYSERPPRYEYVLTERGRDFRPVLTTMLAFGNKHFAPEGASVMIVDAVTGEPAEPIVVDRASGRPIVAPNFVVVPGPTASAATRARSAARAAPRAEEANR